MISSSGGANANPLQQATPPALDGSMWLYLRAHTACGERARERIYGVSAAWSNNGWGARRHISPRDQPANCAAAGARAGGSPISPIYPTPHFPDVTGPLLFESFQLFFCEQWRSLRPIGAPPPPPPAGIAPALTSGEVEEIERMERWLSKRTRVSSKDFITTVGGGWSGGGDFPGSVHDRFEKRSANVERDVSKHKWMSPRTFVTAVPQNRIVWSSR